MASQPMIVLGAAAAVIAAIAIVWATGSWGSVASWFVANGKTVLTVVQVAGIFYCGMEGRLRLGLVLIFTTLATVLWGW